MVRTGLAALLLLAAVGCATYRDDLDRARLHYEANEYDKALVLLEVLERDIDSLSEAERAQYAYFRGMSHFRLEQKRDARHWLGNAAARELTAQGSLTTDAKSRADDTLTKLNAPYFGESSGGEEPRAGRCKTDLDCKKGHYCEAGACTSSSGDAEESSATEPKPDSWKVPSAAPKKAAKKKKPADDEEAE